jgi:hypothetical protein
MLEFSQTQILKLSITWSGNKERNEGIVVPKTTLVPVNDYAHEVLLSSFLKPFQKSEEFFYFHHEEDVSHNAVYQACVEIFQNPDCLSEKAADLTQRIYSVSTLPKITGGEVFVVLFNEVLLQGEAMPAIGIFKTNAKDPFLKIERNSEAFTLQVGEGIASGKMAMAAVILGIDEAEGYRILATDAVSKKDDPSVWLGQFLGAKPIEDNFYNTRHYIEIAKDFITERAGAKFGLDRPETADLIHRSALYFKENDMFEVEDFTSKVFSEPEQREFFKEYKDNYAAEAGLPLADEFDISKQAVRKSSKNFKNVIKLDDNFQIIVNGRRELIERGFDEEKGKHFYKVYFEQEE